MRIFKLKVYVKLARKLLSIDILKHFCNFIINRRQCACGESALLIFNYMAGDKLAIFSVTILLCNFFLFFGKIPT